MRNLMKTAAVAAMMLAPGAAQAVVVYSEDFEDSIASGFSGAGSVQSTQGLSAFGFGAQHLKNDGTAASILSLSGLAAHTSMTLSFSLAMWDSIDLGSDIFQVAVDSGLIINQLFGNYFPPSGSEGPGTPLTPVTDGNFANPQYGYTLDFRDSARAVTVTFAHTASTANISFQFPNSQTHPDESFGIDNVLVESNALEITPPSTDVPEPMTLSLLGAGLLGIGALRRRRA